MIRYNLHIHLMQDTRIAGRARAAPASWDDCMFDPARPLGNDRRTHHVVGCCNPHCTNTTEVSEVALPTMVCSGCSIAR